jgi:cell division protein FtsB
MTNKPTTIKERVLLLSEQQTVSKTKFFTELGQSYSSFTGRNKKTAVPSDFLSRLLVKYPQCNSHWLLTSKGNMLSANNDVKALEIENTDLKEEIIALKKQISLLKGNV